MYPELEQTVYDLKNSFTEIPAERKVLLDEIAKHLAQWLNNKHITHLTTSAHIIHGAVKWHKCGCGLL
jgi:hypothetical protein